MTDTLIQPGDYAETCADLTLLVFYSDKWGLFGWQIRQDQGYDNLVIAYAGPTYKDAKEALLEARKHFLEALDEPYVYGAKPFRALPRPRRIARWNRRRR
jgi:hypothetical protein